MTSSKFITLFLAVGEFLNNYSEHQFTHAQPPEQATDCLRSSGKDVRNELLIKSSNVMVDKFP